MDRLSTASLLALSLVLPFPVVAEVSEATLKSLAAPDSVETSIGTLEFRDGAPTEATAAAVFDAMAFSNALAVYNNSFRGASAYALYAAPAQIGGKANDVLIFGGTLTPYEGALYHTAEGEAKRGAVNAFIRESGEFDGVIDFDAAVRDPANPLRLLPAYDSGDHLHPSDAGYASMAAAVDLRLFLPLRQSQDRQSQDR